MKRLTFAALLLLLLVAAIPAQMVAQASTGPQVKVTSFYSLNRYGYAVVNETVTYANNQSAPVGLPTVQVGIGNLSSLVTNTVLNGGNFTMTSDSAGGPFTVQPNGQLAAGGTTSFTLSSLVSGEVTRSSNGTLRALVLIRPSLSIPVQSMMQTILTPATTRFVTTPSGFSWTLFSDNNTYIMTTANAPAGAAVTSAPYIKTSAAEDFYPFIVYSASRTITVGLNGAPMVVDRLSLKNIGTNALASLPVSPLTMSNARITIVPPAQPKLLNPATLLLSGNAIDLGSAIGTTIAGNSNLTIVYQYPLDHRYYTTSGGQVTLTLPNAPPVPNVVQTYTMAISVPTGMSVVQGQTLTLKDTSQRQTGTTTFAYALALGWAIDGGIPAASIIFVLLFAGLFVSRGSAALEEEETEEETSAERAEAMIKAFDEKTSLINGLWPEIAAMDPNELRKEYFDELRGRVDAFRSRALQRLNEVKQKSTTQKFFDLLNQIHATEREVDRAAKDKLNLYEQYYLRRMRKDVFDRLLPQYTKRLEKALNDLTDELHVVQKEAKLL